MSKSVSILEGGTSKQFGTTAKLRTNLSGGGTCDWVPEDEVQLGTKNINEDGTYYAEDDGYYGYSQVTVNGAGGVTYTAQEGDQIGGVTLEPNEPYYLEDSDGDGNLDETLLPSAIGFAHAPSKLSYTEGEHITLTGAIVRAYKNSGGDWESEDYPSGIVPLSELTLNPVTASGSGTSGGATIEDTTGLSEYWINEMPISYVEGLESITRLDYVWGSQGHQQGYYGGMYDGGAPFVDIVATSPIYCMAFNYLNTQYNEEDYDLIAASLEPFSYKYYSHNQNGVYWDDISANRVTINGNIFYYSILRYKGSFGTNTEIRTNIPFQSLSPASYFNGREPSYIVLFGTEFSTRQQIAVTWNRPMDGEVLSTSFEVEVRPQEEDDNS